MMSPYTQSIIFIFCILNIFLCRPQFFCIIPSNYIRYHRHFHHLTHFPSYQSPISSSTPIRTFIMPLHHTHPHKNIQSTQLRFYISESPFISNEWHKATIQRHFVPNNLPQNAPRFLPQRHCHLADILFGIRQ